MLRLTSFCRTGLLVLSLSIPILAGAAPEQPDFSGVARLVERRIPFLAGKVDFRPASDAAGKLRRIHTLRTARTADDRSVLVLRGSHGRQLLPEPLLRDEPVAQRRQPARSAVASGGRTFGNGPLSVPLPLRPQLLHIQLYLFVLRLERLGARTRLDGSERRQSHARPPGDRTHLGPNAGRRRIYRRGDRRLHPGAGFHGMVAHGQSRRMGRPDEPRHDGKPGPDAAAYPGTDGRTGYRTRIAGLLGHGSQQAPGEIPRRPDRRSGTVGPHLPPAPRSCSPKTRSSTGWPTATTPSCGNSTATR